MRFVWEWGILSKGIFSRHPGSPLAHSDKNREAVTIPICIEYTLPSSHQPESRCIFEVAAFYRRAGPQRMALIPLHLADLRVLTLTLLLLPSYLFPLMSVSKNLTVFLVLFCVFFLLPLTVVLLWSRRVLALNWQMSRVSNFISAFSYFVADPD